MKDWIDSTLFTDNASKINPIWLIVLYASNLLILNWVRPNTDPIINDSKLLNSNTVFQESRNLCNKLVLERRQK